MNSIDKPENFKNLQGAEAVKKIQELSEGAGSCFFCTSINTGKAFATRPMAIQKVDDRGNFWFLSAKDSVKNQEIKVDPAVQLLMQGSSHSDFLCIYGQAEISFDKQKIKELWTPIAKAWFTEGEDDPRISVICVQPSEGYYWDTKNGALVAMVKMAVSAITGETNDDSIQGNIAP